MLTLLLTFIRIGVVVVVLLALLLYFFQHKLIYHPQPYRPDYKRILPPRTVELRYQTSQGTQCAFYVPARSADEPTTIPKRLWLLFGGNGSLALLWHQDVKDAPDIDASFLMIEYPGYGLCEGSPTPKSILESTEAAMDALAAHLGVEKPRLEQDLRVMGHSLGAASALQFAVTHPVRQAVLLAPFTSMRAMAQVVVGRWFAIVLSHHYDNDKHLEQLSRLPNPPVVTILHGKQDNVVPVSMSRALSRQFPAMVKYREIPDGDHISIVDEAVDCLRP